MVQETLVAARKLAEDHLPASSFEVLVHLEIQAVLQRWYLEVPPAGDRIRSWGSHLEVVGIWWDRSQMSQEP